MNNKIPFWVYIIETQKQRLYTGITTDVERRFREHASDTRKAAKFFRMDKPQRVVFQQAFPSRSEALKAEWQIKKLSVAAKKRLIEKRRMDRETL